MAPYAPLPEKAFLLKFAKDRSELKSARLGREPVWTQSLAVGPEDYDTY
jgi:hypothetical protein